MDGSIPAHYVMLTGRSLRIYFFSFKKTAITIFALIFQKTLFWKKKKTLQFQSLGQLIFFFSNLTRSSGLEMFGLIVLIFRLAPLFRDLCIRKARPTAEFQPMKITTPRSMRKLFYKRGIILPKQQEVGCQ